MTRPKIPDPLALGRQALDQLETGVNAYASRKMADADIARTIGSLSQLPRGLKHLTGQAQAGLLKRLDLPSRSELAALAAAVQRIEDKLDQLLPPPSQHAVHPAPKRTRRPPPQAAAAPAQRAAPAKRASDAKGGRR